MVTCVDAYMKEFDILTGAFDSSGIYSVHVNNGDFLFSVFLTVYFITGYQ